MAWVPWFYSAVLIINMGATLYMAKTVREMRIRNEALRMECTIAQRFVSEILDRTEGLIPCDGCGKVIVADEPATVRITPHGTVFGHVMCLPPMPDQT
jgi:hypothetical protein